jgi:hypothetical protein
MSRPMKLTLVILILLAGAGWLIYLGVPVLLILPVLAFWGWQAYLGLSRLFPLNPRNHHPGLASQGNDRLPSA